MHKLSYVQYDVIQATIQYSWHCRSIFQCFLFYCIFTRALHSRGFDDSPYRICVRIYNGQKDQVISFCEICTCCEGGEWRLLELKVEEGI